MAYWVYMRVSTRTQAEKNSTENQREGINKYVADHNITVAGEFSDEGVSGAIDRTADDDAIYKREGLIELLGTAKEGDTIIVQSTSRLWRSDTAKVLIRRELMKSKLNVISVISSSSMLTASVAEKVSYKPSMLLGRSAILSPNLMALPSMWMPSSFNSMLCITSWDWGEGSTDSRISTDSLSVGVTDVLELLVCWL
jgi:hypothetical protein